MMKNIRYTIFIVLANLFFCGGKEQTFVSKDVVQDGFNLIDRNDIVTAKKRFISVKEIEPSNCPASWGLVLVNVIDLVKNLDAIISTLQSSFSGITISPKFTTKNLKTKSISINNIFDTLFSPTVNIIESITENTKVVIDKKCYVKSSIPIKMGDPPFLNFYMRGYFGPTEAAFIGFLSEFLRSLIVFMLSLNFDVSIADILRPSLDIETNINLFGSGSGSGFISSDLGGVSGLQNIASNTRNILSEALSLNTRDWVGLIMSLAHIFDSSPDFLKLRTDTGIHIDDSAMSFSRAFKYASLFFDFIAKYSNEETIFAYEDTEGDGISSDDIIFFNVYDIHNNQWRRGLYIYTNDREMRIDELIITLLVKPVLAEKIRTVIVKFLDEWSKAFDITDPKDIWIHFSDLNNITFSIFSIADTVIFNPKQFYREIKKNPEGLRSLLPYWSDQDNDGYAEFLVEAEVPEGEVDNTCIKQESRISNIMLEPMNYYSDTSNTTLATWWEGSIERNVICSVTSDSYLSEEDAKYHIVPSFSVSVPKFSVTMNSVRVRTTGNLPLTKADIKSRRDQILSERSQEQSYPSVTTSFASSRIFTQKETLILDSCAIDGNLRMLLVFQPIRGDVWQKVFFSTQDSDYLSLFGVSQKGIFGYIKDWTQNKIKEQLLYPSVVSVFEENVQPAMRNTIPPPKISFDMSFFSNSQFLAYSEIFYFFIAPPWMSEDRWYTAPPLNSLFLSGCIFVIQQCTLTRDSSHFMKDFVFRGFKTDVHIKKDCMFPIKGEMPFVYIAFRDPTFFNSIKVNLKNIKVPCNDEQKEDWVFPDLYSANKVIANFIAGTVAPLVQIVSGGLQLTGILGTGDIIAGEICK